MADPAPPQPQSGIPRARAYLITFSTYGARLHGAPSGSVDSSHRIYGTPLCPPDDSRASFEEKLMPQPPYVMDATRRQTVLAACLDVCRFRSWHLFAAHIRTNHAHLVLQASQPPERVLNDLKGYASRSLTKACLDTNQRKRWSRHGSTRYLWDEQQLRAAINYVFAEQGDPMAVYIAPDSWHPAVGQP